MHRRAPGRERPRSPRRTRPLTRLQRAWIAAAALLAFAFLWAGGSLHAHPLCAPGVVQIEAADGSHAAGSSARAERECSICRVLATCLLVAASRVLGVLDEPVLCLLSQAEPRARSLRRRSLPPSRAPPLPPIGRR
jgi:hypothetical protein